MYKAKQRYQNQAYAESYDQRRFSTWAGKTAHRLDTRALDKATAKWPVGSAVLDVPCGTGRLTVHLARKGFLVTGADISESMIDVAKKKNFSGNLVEFIVSPAENLPFPDKYFDYSVSGRFLAHLPPDVRIVVLKELSRISRTQVIAGYHIRNRFADISRYIRTRGKVRNFQLSRVPLSHALKEVDAAGLKVIDIIKLVPVLHDYRYLVLERP